MIPFVILSRLCPATRPSLSRRATACSTSPRPRRPKNENQRCGNACRFQCSFHLPDNTCLRLFSHGFSHGFESLACCLQPDDISSPRRREQQQRRPRRRPRAKSPRRLPPTLRELTQPCGDAHGRSRRKRSPSFSRCVLATLARLRWTYVPRLAVPFTQGHAFVPGTRQMHVVCSPQSQKCVPLLSQSLMPYFSGPWLRNTPVQVSAQFVASCIVPCTRKYTRLTASAAFSQPPQHQPSFLPMHDKSMQKQVQGTGMPCFFCVANG